MGKGQRARLERKSSGDTKSVLKAKEEQKKKRNKIITGVCVTVIALMLVFGITFSAVASSGVFLRSSIAAESENYEVDAAMMSYYLYSNYYSFANQMSDYLSYFNLDTTKSLKTQNYSDTQTWFDYFADQTKNSVQELLVLSEAAKADGVALDDEDKATVDGYIETLESNAKELNYSKSQYITKMYGNGVKEKDVRACLELSVLASKYREIKSNSFTYTDDDIASYYNDNKNTFNYVDVKSYTFTSTIPDGATDEEKTEINSVAKTQAEGLAACENPDAFDAYIREYLTTETTTDEEKTKNEDTITSTLTEGKAYSENDEAMKWAFDATREQYDSLITEGTNSFTVTMLVKLPYRYDYITKNIRHILLTTEKYENEEAAQSMAQTLLEQWKSGAATEESFGELAAANSEDTGSNNDGGLYENMTKGTDDAFDEWVFDSTRTSGDTAVIKTSYGYHVMYFVGDGEAAWMASVRSTLKSNDYDTFLESIKTTYTVTYDDKSIAKIAA